MVRPFYSLIWDSEAYIKALTPRVEITFYSLIWDFGFQVNIVNFIDTLNLSIPLYGISKDNSIHRPRPKLRAFYSLIWD